MKIGKKEISDTGPCFIIAEAGANFRISDNPKINFKHALELIDIAVEARADAVKFQLYRAEKLYVEDAGYADYIGKKKSIFQIIKDMEVPYEWLPKLKEYCDKKGIIFLCTPFDEEAVDELEKVGIQAYKVASYSINHIPLLKYIARKEKPMLLSTGASDIKDIEIAIDAIKGENNNQIALLQCTAKYPAPLSAINLRSIVFLKKKFNIPVGLSDHSREPLIAPLGAVALGAKIIEKHYTTDNSLPGPDHGFAILALELKDLVKGIRGLEAALGNENKIVLDVEGELYDFAREYIYANKDIKKGETFTRENLIILRSGKAKKGLDPIKYEQILGKKSKKNLSRNDSVTEDCIDG